MKHPTAQLPLFPPPGSPQTALPDTILDTTCDLLATLLVHVLTEISARIPDGLAVVFEELTVDGQVVRMRGHTESFGTVDQLRTALASFPNFTDIRVSEIQDDEKLGVKNFSITISLSTGEPS